MRLDAGGTKLVKEVILAFPSLLGALPAFITYVVCFEWGPLEILTSEPVELRKRTRIPFRMREGGIRIRPTPDHAACENKISHI